MTDQREMTSAELASRIVELMPSSNVPNPFMERYAEYLEKAAELDDLSFVRMGREAEVFETGFRQFVSEFPGAPAVTLPEGEFEEMAIYLARINRELRRALLKGWSEVIRAKALQLRSGNPGNWKMKKFAVSDCVYAPGLICLDSDGIVTHDPKALGPESVIGIRESMGYEIVEFEDLISQLVASGTDFRGPAIPASLSLSEAAQAEQYSRYCVSLAEQISEKILG